MKRRLVVSVTGTRADFGLMRPVYRAIMDAPDLDLLLIVTGMHLLPAFRRSLEEIKAEGVPYQIVSEPALGSAELGMAKALGAELAGIAEILQRQSPDIVLLQGDRGEMLAAAIAAAHQNIAIVHMSGGDCSGTIDDSVRGAISCFAHFHLVTCEESKNNLIAKGEKPDRVVIAGEPALDVIFESAENGQAAFAELGIDRSLPFILATQHPVTTEADRAVEQMRITLRALDRLRWPTLFTYPNTDNGGQGMTDELELWRECQWLTIVPTLGTNCFLAALKNASVFVGNSSSGILEAPSFKTPVVNIGTRQYGRLRASNVIDVGHNEDEIEAAIRRAVFDASFRDKLELCVNPYGDGEAARRTVDVLRRLVITENLIAKWLSVSEPFLSPSPS